MSCVCGYLVYVEYDKFKHELEFVDCQGLTSSKLAMTGMEQKFTPLQKSVNFL